MTHLAFVDTETTGLDPAMHELWEVAVIVRGHPDAGYDGQWCWQVRPRNLPGADPKALAVGAYYRRASVNVETRGAHLVVSPDGVEDDLTPFGTHATTRGAGQVAFNLAHLLDGATLVANNPAFDAAMIAAFLRAHGQARTWHYRLEDVVTRAAGHLGWTTWPLASRVLSRACGVELPTPEEEHTALGDARWVARWWDALDTETITSDGPRP